MFCPRCPWDICSAHVDVLEIRSLAWLTWEDEINGLEAGIVSLAGFNKHWFTLWILWFSGIIGVSPKHFGNLLDTYNEMNFLPELPGKSVDSRPWICF